MYERETHVETVMYMKTQISNLINGTKRIIRDENHPKYLTAKKSSSHDGYAGTNYQERMSVAYKVVEENPDNLVILIKGKQYTLHTESSCSGTITYVATITGDDFASITGEKPPFELESTFHLEITSSMTVNIAMFTRKNKDSNFKQRGIVNIDEAFVTII